MMNAKDAAQIQIARAALATRLLFGGFAKSGITPSGGASAGPLSRACCCSGIKVERSIDYGQRRRRQDDQQGYFHIMFEPFNCGDQATACKSRYENQRIEGDGS